MTREPNPLQLEIKFETWNEELARSKKYREATQKRKREKQARREIEKWQQTLQVGRLLIEP